MANTPRLNHAEFLEYNLQFTLHASLNVRCSIYNSSLTFNAELPAASSTKERSRQLDSERRMAETKQKPRIEFDRAED